MVWAKEKATVLGATSKCFAETIEGDDGKDKRRQRRKAVIII